MRWSEIPTLTCTNLRTSAEHVSDYFSLYRMRIKMSDVRSLTVAGSTLYAGTAAGVFVGTDCCATWAAMNTGLPN